MITSTSEILNEIVAEINYERTQAQASVSSTCSQNKSKKEFTVRYFSMQSQFIRSSWVQKIKFLTELMEGLTPIDSLALVLNTIRISASKATVYGECQYSTNFIYDKKLNDHNRSMHETTLILSQTADVQWFKTLEASEQILILVGLLRLGGGSVMHHIFENGVKLYNRKMDNVPKLATMQSDSIVEIKTQSPDLLKSEDNLQIDKQKTPIVLLMSRHLSIKSGNDQDSRKLWNPQDPFVIEVQKNRKIWTDLIGGYRKKVQGSKTVKMEKSKESKKSSKPSKSGKPSKGGKSVKSEKISKNKKKSAKDGEELDQIQLLPIWIVKKIFGYVDGKTLKKAKNVNKYWAYAIGDLQKEQKARKALNKFINKMETSLHASQLNFTLDDKLQHLQDIPKKVPNKRLLKLAERGATHPKVSGKLAEPLMETTLSTLAIKKIIRNTILPLELLTPYPRNLQHATPLYKVPSCFTYELAFTKMQFGDNRPEEGGVKHFRVPKYSIHSNEDIFVEVEGGEKHESVEDRELVVLNVNELFPL